MYSFFGFPREVCFTRSRQGKAARRSSVSRFLRSEPLEDRRLLAADVWINEIHYDNTGNDVGEFVEVAGPAGTDLTGWSIALYNGNGGVVYGTIDLSGNTIDDEAGTGFGALAFFRAGIQNGAPDGLALVDDLGAVIQFLSYEGDFVATDGPAIGQTSVDIGVFQTGSDAIGLTLQLKGVGTTYADFTWNAPSADSPGSLNDGQSISGAAAGILVTTTGSGNLVSESGPTSDTFSVVLTGAPTNDVSIALTSANGEITIDPPTLVFTPSNWDQPQTVTFTAIDDADVEREHSDFVQFVVSSSDPIFDGFVVPDQLVVIIDNDFGALIPTVINEFVADHTGADTATFAELLSLPNMDLIDLTLIEIEGDAGGTSRGVIDRVFPLGTTDANGYLVIPNSAGFDPENGAATLLLVYGFTGTATQDLDTDDDGILDVTPWISIVDSVGYRSDAGHFVYSPAALNKGNVNGLPVFGGASRIPNGFDSDSPSDWVSNDFFGEGLGLGGIAAPGQAINTPGLPNRVKPGVLVTESDGSTSVSESGLTDTLSIVLASPPTADVTVSISVDSQLTVDLTTALFTTENWNVPQVVIVGAVDDNINEGPHAGNVSFAVASADTDYNLFTISPIVVAVEDNDQPGVEVTPTTGLITTEQGGTATFTVRLTSPPTADVVIPLTSSDTTEGVISASILTFTSLNWSVPQTVTITGVDDAIDDGDIAYTIILGEAESIDFEYSGFDVPDVSVTNLDDEFNTSALINEVLVNPPGQDGPFEYVELRGAPNSSLDGIYFVQIEGDGAAAGIADFVVDLSSFNFGSNGLLVIKAPTGGHVPGLGTTVVTSTQLENTGGGFENGTVTSLLVFSPLGIEFAADYDTNNDGVLDALPATAVILDSVGWTDGGAGDLVYSSARLEPSSGTPDAATRFAGDLTPNSATAWYAGDLLDTAGNASLTYDPSRATTPIPDGAALTPGDVNYTATPVQQFALEGDLALAEGNSGTTPFVFNVLRLGNSAGAAVVDFAFVAGDTNADDFGGTLPVNGQVFFADGQELATLTIDVSGDTDVEADEIFGLMLTATSVGVVLQGANTASATILNDDVADPVPPTVGSVFARSTQWSNNFVDSVDGGGTGGGNGIGFELVAGGATLPWNNVNTLVVQFSEDVLGVSASSLELRNSDGPLPINVAYDAVNFRAVISLATPLPFSKLRLAVADTVTDAAGNALDGDSIGGAGGTYDLRFDVVPGDSDGNGRVNGSDLGAFANAFNAQPGQPNFNPRANWNGDDRVNGADLGVLADNFNRNIENLENPAPPFSGGGAGTFFSFSRDEFFKNFDLDDEEDEQSDNLLSLG